MLCRRRFAATLLVALVWPAAVRLVSAQENASSEYQVKAAFLFHFAQFVEWPQDTFKDADSPFTYCTIGDDPFHGILDQTLSGKTIGSRLARVQHFTLAREIQGCQVLFISVAQKERRQEEQLASMNRHAVLTVGETAHFAQDGGIIGFCLEEKKVRFEINVEAAEKARLRISAKLLALAKTVLGNPRRD